MFAKSLRRFVRTSHIRVTGFVRDESRILDEFVGARVVSSMTRTSRFRGTVENVLDAKVNVVARTQTRNLDAVGKAGNCAMRPAGTAAVSNKR